MGVILVTGSHGLIGREVVKKLRERGDTALCMDLRAPAPADIRDRSTLREILQSKSGKEVSGVIHLAAVSRVAWGEQAPELTNEINVGGTQTIIEEIMRLPRPPWLLFASSREVYGNPTSLPVREDVTPAPLNNYARSKAEAEALIVSGGASGLHAAILRFSNVYGNEHDHPDRALPSLLWKAMQSEPLKITGRDTFFDFVHVNDCARGVMATIDHLASQRSQLPPTHLATGRSTSLSDLAELVVRVTGSTSDIIVVPARPFDTEGFCGDPTRAKALLGWEAAIDIYAGVQLLYDRFLSLGRGCSPVDLPSHFEGKADLDVGGAPRPRRLTC